MIDQVDLQQKRDALANKSKHQVDTMYGEGVVISHNAKTDCVVVALAWGGDDFDAKATLLSNAVKPLGSTTSAANRTPSKRRPLWSRGGQRNRASPTEVRVGDTVTIPNTDIYGMGTVIDRDAARGYVWVEFEYAAGGEGDPLSKAIEMFGEDYVIPHQTSERSSIDPPVQAKGTGTHGVQRSKKNTSRCAVM
jgi:hypothetical protein